MREKWQGRSSRHPYSATSTATTPSAKRERGSRNCFGELVLMNKDAYPSQPTCMARSKRYSRRSCSRDARRAISGSHLHGSAKTAAAIADVAVKFEAMRLPPQCVNARHGVAAYRHRHVIIEKPRDPGKAGERFPCFLGRHLARQGSRAAVQRTLIHRATPSRWPFAQENHRFGDTIYFFYRVSLPARYPHGRKEMQAVHNFLPVDRDALDRTK